MKPELGQKITAVDRLVRANNFGSDGKKVWKRYIEWINRPKPVSGIYVGSRTKQNGYSTWDSDGIYWTKTGQVDVWLIVEKDRENPVFVLPEDCKWEKKQ